jgi:hypothetical protein
MDYFLANFISTGVVRRILKEAKPRGNQAATKQQPVRTPSSRKGKGKVKRKGALSGDDDEGDNQVPAKPVFIRPKPRKLQRSEARVAELEAKLVAVQQERVQDLLKLKQQPQPPQPQPQQQQPQPQPQQPQSQQRLSEPQQRLAELEQQIKELQERGPPVDLADLKKDLASEINLRLDTMQV